MLILFPYTTDAPIYHWPKATVGLIVANWLVFAAQIAYPDFTENYLLQFGTINPAQWVTSFFMHADFCHLIGNMIFLWAFGIVVEGKIGWWRFLAVYFATGVIESISVQLFMLKFSIGGALGASGAIFGLMAICMIWAPVNHFIWKFGAVFFFRPFSGEFETPILATAFFYLAINFFYATMSGFSMSSELLHLIGAIVGGAIGIGMLKCRLVDCEGYDLLAMMRGELGKQPEPTPSQVRERQEAKEQERERIENELATIKKYIRNGHFELAHLRWIRLKRAEWKIQLGASESWQLIAGLIEKREYSAAIALIEDHLDQHESNRGTMLINLAKVHLHHLNQPREALKTLNRLSELELKENQDRLAKRLRMLAFNAISDGALEMQ